MIGLPTKWCFSLSVHDDDEEDDAQTVNGQNPKKYLGVFLDLLDKPKRIEEVNASYSLKIRNPENKTEEQPATSLDSNYAKNCKADFHNFAEKKPWTWGFRNLLDIGVKLDALPLVNGALVIDLEFVLYAAKQRKKIDAIVDLPVKLEGFKLKFLQKLSDDLGKHELMTGPTAGAATTLIAKDGKEFRVCRGILSGIPSLNLISIVKIVAINYYSNYRSKINSKECSF